MLTSLEHEVATAEEAGIEATGGPVGETAEL
jgi:hypothetical protein